MASVVVEEIAHRILGGALREGAVLPTEPALCEEFGFSRSVIREGLKLLEERGLVRVEQGRGTTVQGARRVEPARSRPCSGSLSSTTTTWCCSTT